MYPHLEIDLEKIRENTQKVIELCKKQGMEVVGITKGVCGDLRIANSMKEGGIKIFGDSRIQNLISLRKNFPSQELMLIRSPMLSEVEKVVKYVDYSVNTEIDVLKKLSQVSLERGKVHKAIIMVDVGDRREGILPSDALSFIKKAVNLKGIEIVGLGTNMGCFGGVLPTYENQKILVDLAKDTEKELGIELPIISTGGTVVLSLIEKGDMPKGITQIRIGEAILLGKSTTDERIIPWLSQKTFTLKAEIIEIKEKPSMPEGITGKNALGETPQFEDRGIRKRAIIAIGAQDVEIKGLISKDEKIDVIGGSSDHIIADVTDSPRLFKVGDILSFEINYETMLRAMLSPYVDKVYL